MLIGPFLIKTPDTYTDKKKTTVLVPGEKSFSGPETCDGLLYKGCERPHWRDKMPGFTGKKSKKLFGKTPTWSSIIPNLFPLCSSRMDNEHTVHGIEHDEGTTF